jgi:hypothetical protein
MLSLSSLYSIVNYYVNKDTIVNTVIKNIKMKPVIKNDYYIMLLNKLLYNYVINNIVYSVSNNEIFASRLYSSRLYDTSKIDFLELDSLNIPIIILKLVVKNITKIKGHQADISRCADLLPMLTHVCSLNYENINITSWFSDNLYYSNLVYLSLSCGDLDCNILPDTLETMLLDRVNITNYGSFKNVKYISLKYISLSNLNALSGMIAAEVDNCEFITNIMPLRGVRYVSIKNLLITDISPLAYSECVTINTMLNITSISSLALVKEATLINCPMIKDIQCLKSVERLHIYKTGITEVPNLPKLRRLYSDVPLLHPSTKLNVYSLIYY